MVVITVLVLSGLLTRGNADSFEAVVLCYHHLVEDRKPENECEIVVTDFKKHMEYLHEHDYQPLSLKEFFHYSDKGEFPGRAVLLTFDDGYASFYEKAYPLLKKYNFPAAVFPIVSHMPGLEQEETFSDKLSFEQLRIMDEESGLISLGSHSYDLHYYDGERPAVYPKSNESVEEYECRIRRDLRTGQNLLELQTDLEVKALAWPYGTTTESAEEIAEQAGFDLIFTLEPKPFTEEDTTSAIPRFPADALGLEELKALLENILDQ